MNRDELLDAIWTGNREGLVKGLAPVSEGERKALPGKELAALRTKNRGAWSDGHIERLQKAFGKSILGEAMELAPEVNPHYFAVGHMIDLALVGIGSAAQVAHVRPNHDPTFVQLLDDRRPRWATKWLEQGLAPATSRVRTSSIPVETLDALICSGICKKPKCAGYYQTLACDMYWLDRFEWAKGQENPRISDYLLAHPHFLEDVYSIFDVVTVHFLGDPIAQHEKRGKEHWSMAMQRLAAEGHLDRGRLLQASARGLHHDFPVNILSSYVAFHKALAPTSEELAELQYDYLELLSSEVDRVSAFAIAMLKQANRHGVLDDAAYLEAAPDMLRSSVKASIATILSVFRAIDRRDSTHRSSMTTMLVNAVSDCPPAAITELLLEQLVKWAARLDARQKKKLARTATEVSPTLQPLAARLGGEEATPKSSRKPHIPKSKALRTRGRTNAALTEWYARAGLIADGAGGWGIAPIRTATHEVPQLTCRNTIAPMATVDELLDTALAAFGAVESADTVERILDGVSRLGLARPSGFDRKAAPLLAQAKFEDVESWDSAKNVLTKFVQCWLEGVEFELGSTEQVYVMDRATRKMAYVSIEGVGEFKERLMQEIIHRLRQGVSAPLLSFPTHEDGWIAPATLVERCLELEKRGLDLPRLDLVQALLRLAPEGRAKALKTATTLNHPRARALCWALGGKDVSLKKTDETDVWLAAGRARDLRGRLDLLKARASEIEGADGFEPVRYEIEYNTTLNKKFGRRPLYERFVQFSREPDLFPVPDAASHPTRAMQNRVAMGGGSWGGHWMLMTWPLNLDSPIMKAGILELVQSIESRSNQGFAISAIFERIARTDELLNAYSLRVLALGLMNVNGDSRQQAMDALESIVADGRLEPEGLAQTLIEMTQAYWFKLNRVSESLATLGALSPLHGWFSLGVIGRLLMGAEDPPRDVHHLLGAMVNVLNDFPLPIPAELIRFLTSYSGGGKAGKLVKLLLARVEGEPALEAEVRTQLIETRLARAERWASV